MPVNPSVKSYADLRVKDDYNLHLEHQYDSKYDLHGFLFKRMVLDENGKDTEILSDIRITLDTEMFRQFCQFFENVNGVKYGK